MRSRFDEQLAVLNKGLIEMGALCEEAIALSSRVLMNYSLVPVHPDSEEALNFMRDMETLKSRVLATDFEIDNKEREIESLCLRLLLQQQPVAGDLRTVSAALKMITDMERIGDQASDIAELSDFVKGSNIRHRTHLHKMAKETAKMVTDSIDSFVRRDLELTKAVIDYDDVVDGLFTEVKNELIELIKNDSGNGELYLDILMIAKYYERIGDHATNIAEWVRFSITGIRKE
ncbi:MAG: phosphate signaling complex protein PhoU [Oscillospiraceae bacterium]|nr:phosphate signaling complex protein PhoU [Oscillospiraceae bacterium]